MHIYDIIWHIIGFRIGIQLAASLMWGGLLVAAIDAIRSGDKHDGAKAILQMVFLGMFASPTWAMRILGVARDLTGGFQR